MALTSEPSTPGPDLSGLDPALDYDLVISTEPTVTRSVRPDFLPGVPCLMLPDSASRGPDGYLHCLIIDKVLYLPDGVVAIYGGTNPALGEDDPLVTWTFTPRNSGGGARPVVC